jgi:hypothetical protein
MPAKKNNTSANKYPSGDINNRNIIAARNILDKVKVLTKVCTD